MPQEAIDVRLKIGGGRDKSSPRRSNQIYETTDAEVKNLATYGLGRDYRIFFPNEKAMRPILQKIDEGVQRDMDIC